MSQDWLESQTHRSLLLKNEIIIFQYYLSFISLVTLTLPLDSLALLLPWEDLTLLQELSQLALNPYRLDHPSKLRHLASPVLRLALNSPSSNSL